MDRGSFFYSCKRLIVRDLAKGDENQNRSGYAIMQSEGDWSINIQLSIRRSYNVKK